MGHRKARKDQRRCWQSAQDEQEKTSDDAGSSLRTSKKRPATMLAVRSGRARNDQRRCWQFAQEEQEKTSDDAGSPLRKSKKRPATMLAVRSGRARKDQRGCWLLHWKAASAA